MKINIILLWVVVIALAGLFLWPNVGNELSLGSVTVGNEYLATTTPITGVWTDQLIKKGQGAVGSYVITKAGNLEAVLYDATSTQKWFGGKSSSTQQLMYIPANLAAGTYVLDVRFIDGLFLDVISGTGATSTITYR